MIKFSECTLQGPPRNPKIVTRVMQQMMSGRGLHIRHFQFHHKNMSSYGEPTSAQCEWMDAKLHPIREYLRDLSKSIPQNEDIPAIILSLQHQLEALSVEFAAIRWKNGCGHPIRLPQSNKLFIKRQLNDFLPKKSESNHSSVAQSSTSPTSLPNKSQPTSPKEEDWSDPIQSRKQKLQLAKEQITQTLLNESETNDPNKVVKSRAKPKKIISTSLRSMSKAEYKKRFKKPKNKSKKVKVQIEQQTERKILAFLTECHFIKARSTGKGTCLYRRSCCTCGKCSSQFEPKCTVQIVQKVEMAVSSKPKQYYQYKHRDIRGLNKEADVLFGKV